MKKTVLAVIIIAFLTCCIVSCTHSRTEDEEKLFAIDNGEIQEDDI